MSQFPKLFVSAREFVESWDKEIYKLTNLDFFIYLMVNQLGNELDHHFLMNQRKQSPLALSFESIGTLCFSIGDSFECFLEEEKQGRYTVDYRMEKDIQGETIEHNGRVHRRIKNLQSLITKGYFSEQSFRADLMEYVIIDTLLQFYYEEIGIEFDDEDLEIMELADFIEEAMIDFIRTEGQTLIRLYGEPAIECFEKLLADEEGRIQDCDWQSNGKDLADAEGDWIEKDHLFTEIPEVIAAFVSEYENKKNSNIGCLACNISYFESFLIEGARIKSIYELTNDHICQFLSIWLVHHFAQEKEPHFSHVFQTMARFTTWLNHRYNIDYKDVFLSQYECVKTEVPRVIRALNTYLDAYNLFEVILLRDDQELEQIDGFFEITALSQPHRKTLDVADIHQFRELNQVYFSDAVYSRLKPGDILQASLIRKDSRWELLEIHYIFPRSAKALL